MTNQYKAQYDERREAVLDFLDSCIQQFKEWGQETDTVPLEKFRSNIENGLFSIVLVGEFSAGKSTFLNALMHKRILPSFTRETTATVNFLRHVDQAPAGALGRVYYRDGSIEDLTDLNRSTIENVVSTNGDTEEHTVATTIDHVDLFLDSDFLKDGVMLVDSPGLNGMKGNHREITEQQIKASHACIFMFRAEQPGSKTEFESLRQLKEQSNNIFFVLNKIDAIRSSEQQTVEGVIQDLRDTYHKQFPDEAELPKIWPVASFAALVARDSNETEYLGNEVISTQERRDELEKFSRFADFEDRLWKYLTQGERARDQLCEPVSSAITLLVAERDKYSAQLKLLQENASSENLKKQKENLEASLADLKKDRQKASPELTRQVREVVQHLDENLGRQTAEIQRKMISRFDDYETPSELVDEARGVSAEIDQRFCQLARKLDETLRDELLRIISDEYDSYLHDLDAQFAASAENNVFTFNSKKLDITDVSIGVDLDKFEEKCHSLRLQIQELEKGQQESKLSAIQARSIENAIREKKDELRDLRQSRQFISETFVIPDVSYHNEETDASYWRDGLFGLVGNVLFGRKHATTIKTVADTSARDSAVQQRNDRINALDADITHIQQEINQTRKPEKSSEEFELAGETAKAHISQLEERLQELRANHLDELNTKSAKACKKIRREIRDHVEAISYDISSAIRTYIKKQERTYLLAVQDMLNTSLNQEITAAQKRLDDVLSAIETEGEDRDRQINDSMQAKEAASKLIDRGIELCSLLEETMSDHVEQEAL